MFEKTSLKVHEGKFYGEYRAKVLNNQDPKHLGRIIVECPSVWGEGIESPWCFGKFPIASKTYGFYMVPNVGDWVWLTFEKGSPDYPVWNGSPFTTVVPNELKKTKTGQDRKNPTIFMVKTPIGHSVVMDDDPNNPEIRITHKSGSVITMSADGSIRITPVSGKPTYVDSDLITNSIQCVNITSSGNTKIAGNLTVSGNSYLG